MEKMTPERVVEIMKEGGDLITTEQAEIILEFLRKLADLVVANFIGKNCKR